MRLSMSSLIAAALFGLMPDLTHAAEPAPRFVARRMAAATPGGERGVPSVYQYDDGTAENALTAGNVELCWAHRFDAVPGTDIITSVSAAWGSTTDGMPARIFIWQDPTSDGNPADKVLLGTADITVQNSGTNILNVYALPSPVQVTGEFYVGVSVGPVENAFPLQLDLSTPYSNGRSFYAITAPPLNPSTAQLTPMETAGFPHYFLLRADATSVSFTYQGRLTSTGTPYTGSGDITATMYDAATDGNVVANTYAVANVSFEKGIFSVRIPAGESAFESGGNRWLEIAVRTPAGSGAYTILSPRQLITPAPTAISAISAVNATSAATAVFADAAASVPWEGITGVPDNIALSPWNPAPSGIAYAGRVGIGAIDPAAPLSISAEDGVGLQSWHNADGDRKWNLNLNSFGPDSPGLFFSEDGVNPSNLVLSEGGNIGMGTGAPAARLELATGALGGDWHMLFTNFAVNNFRGGARLADSGFFEMTNNAGAANPNFARLSSTGSWTAVSDARLKSDITTADGNLDAVLRLRPVNFRWKGDGAQDFGLIAQEVRQVLPKLVTGDEAKDSLTLNYSQLSVVAIGAIQEQQAQINMLKADIAGREAENTALKARLAAVEAALARMNSATSFTPGK